MSRPSGGMRMLIIRKRALLGSALSLIIFSASISVILGIGEAPKAFLGSPEVFVISDRGSESVINSRLDISLADQLVELGLVELASPEIFAFGAVRGHAVVIRGVDFERFMEVEGIIWSPGSPLPADPSSALVGKRLADRASITVGDGLPLVGSFDMAVVQVGVAGIVESGTGVDDEIMVSLPVGQLLSGAPSDQVSIVRVKGGDLSELERIFAPKTARFSIYDLSIPRSEVGQGYPVEIGVTLKNWGDAPGSAQVTIRDSTDDRTLLQDSYTLGAGKATRIKVNASFDTLGEHVIAVVLSGDLPQSLSGGLTVRGPYLTLAVPERVVENRSFVVQVRDHLMRPVDGANISIDGVQHTFDFTNGSCRIDLSLAQGMHYITATYPGYEEANETFEVMDPSLLPPDAVIEVYDLVLSPSAVRTGQNCTVTIYVQNSGGSNGSGTVRLYVDGVFRWSSVVTLEPLQATVLFHNVSFTTAGDRGLSVEQFAKTLSVESVYQINPQMVQLLLRYGAEGSLDPSRGEMIYHTAKISESNIVIVLVSMAVLSAMLVTLAVSTSFMKEINDNMRVIGILRTIGTSSRQLLGMIFRESIVISLIGAAIGIVGGVCLALLVASTDKLLAFGHVITPVLDPSFLLVASLGSVAICVGSGLIAGLSVSRRVAIRIIRGLDDEAREHPTLAQLIGDE